MGGAVDLSMTTPPLGQEQAWTRPVMDTMMDMVAQCLLLEWATGVEMIIMNEGITTPGVTPIVLQWHPEGFLTEEWDEKKALTTLVATLDIPLDLTTTVGAETGLVIVVMGAIPGTEFI